MPELVLTSEQPLTEAQQIFNEAEAALKEEKEGFAEKKARRRSGSLPRVEMDDQQKQAIEAALQIPEKIDEEAAAKEGTPKEEKPAEATGEGAKEEKTEGEAAADENKINKTEGNEDEAAEAKAAMIEAKAEKADDPYPVAEEKPATRRISLEEMLMGANSMSSAAKKAADENAEANQKAAARQRRRSRDMEQDVFGMRVTDVEKLRKNFDSIDTDGSGTIEVDELNMALKLAGKKVSTKQVEGLFTKFDTAGKGSMSFNDYQKMIKEWDVILDEYEKEEAARQKAIEEGNKQDLSQYDEFEVRERRKSREERSSKELEEKMKSTEIAKAKSERRKSREIRKSKELDDLKVEHFLKQGADGSVTEGGESTDASVTPQSRSVRASKESMGAATSPAGSGIAAAKALSSAA